MSMCKYTVMSNDIHGNHWVETVHDGPEATIGAILRKANLHDVHLTGTRTIVMTIEDAPGVSRCPDSGLLVGLDEESAEDIAANIVANARWEERECLIDEDSDATRPLYLTFANPEHAGYAQFGNRIVGSGNSIAEAMACLRRLAVEMIQQRRRTVAA